MTDHAARDRLREQARSARRLAHRSGGAQAAIAVRDHFTRALENGLEELSEASIAGYWPKGDELDLRPLLDALAGAGRTLALPRMAGAGAPLAFHRWRPGDALIEGSHGIMEPQGAAALMVPRIVMVPLLAFDPAGTRLGHGAGYYDRTLAALRAAGPVCAVGMGFASQLVAGIPRHGGDAGLDWMVTEDGIVEFS